MRRPTDGLIQPMPGKLGIVVACDPPGDLLYGAMMEGELQPVSIIFRWVKRHGQEERFNAREVSDVEAIGIMQKFLADGTIGVMFTPRGRTPHSLPHLLKG